MAFRLFLGVWALHSVVYDSPGKAFVTLVVLGCFNGMGETVFASLAVYARLRAKWEKERTRKEELRKFEEERREALAQAQAASSDKYYELGMKGEATQNAG